MRSASRPAPSSWKKSFEALVARAARELQRAGCPLASLRPLGRVLNAVHDCIAHELDTDATHGAQVVRGHLLETLCDELCLLAVVGRHALRERFETARDLPTGIR
jgi:hypothetical protein